MQKLFYYRANMPHFHSDMKPTSKVLNIRTQFSHIGVLGRAHFQKTSSLESHCFFSAVKLGFQLRTPQTIHVQERDARAKCLLSMQDRNLLVEPDLEGSLRFCLLSRPIVFYMRQGTLRRGPHPTPLAVLARLDGSGGHSLGNISHQSIPLRSMMPRR